MEDFNTLDLYQKSQLLKRQATFLVTLYIDEYSVKLYSWDRFFIEEYFDELQQVTKINIAEQDNMVKYLENISLGDLGHPAVQ